MDHLFKVSFHGCRIQWAQEDGLEAYDARVAVGARPHINNSTPLESEPIAASLETVRALDRLAKTTNSYRVDWLAYENGTCDELRMQFRFRNTLRLLPNFPGLDFGIDNAPRVARLDEFVDALIDLEARSIVAAIKG